MAHIYTKEQAEFIKKHAFGRTTQELTNLLNDHFGLTLKASQIKSYKGNHKINNGVDNKFKPGHTPVNKGKKGGGWEPTQFKKGSIPHNYLMVGSERVNGDDYIDIKISETNTWKAKHIIIWEKHNGPVPKNHAVIFGDKNKRNFDINNLILVSRKQLLTLNINKLIQDDAELTKTGVIIADIYHKITERKNSTTKKGGKLNVK
jgi:hypothetical protein